MGACSDALAALARGGCAAAVDVLAADPVEDPDVRAAAADRLAGPARS